MAEQSCGKKKESKNKVNPTSFRHNAQDVLWRFSFKKESKCLRKVFKFVVLNLCRTLPFENSAADLGLLNVVCGHQQ